MIGYYCNVESWTGSCTTQSLGKLTLFTRYHGKYLMYMDTVQIPATKWQQYRFNNATIIYQISWEVFDVHGISTDTSYKMATI